jgi:lysophospholipase L1-like esterase
VTASCAVRAAAEPGSEYLALGDSITYGSHPVLPGEPSFHPYPDLVAQRYGLHAVNAACPGETAASLIDMHALSHGCENSSHSSTGFRQHGRLHVWYPSSQLTFAEKFLGSHPHTRLVSVAIGLNDLFVCNELHQGCPAPALADLQRALGAHLDTILSGIRGAGYHGTIVVLQYYALQYPDAKIQAINAAIAAAAHRHGALVADGYTAFRADAGAAGSSCAAGLQALQLDGHCNLHPSQAGQRVLARAVEQALDGAHWNAPAA